MTIRRTTHLRLPIPDFTQSPWHNELIAALQALDNAVYRNLVANGSGVWDNDTDYFVGNIQLDEVLGTMWIARVSHTSPATGTFADYRAAHPTDWAAFALNFNPRGAWANDTTYGVYDLVYVASLGIIAQCTTTHVSSSAPLQITDDVANWVYWAVLPQNFVAGGISFDPAVTTLVSTDVQAALVEIFNLIATTDAATDAVVAALAATVSALDAATTAALALKAPLLSPTFTGTPTAPTAAAKTSTTQLATTSFVQQELADRGGGMDGLVITVASNTTVTVVANYVTMFNGSKYITRPVSSTVNLGTAGAVDALDTGVIAIDSRYHLWAISKEDGTTKVIASLQSTANGTFLASLAAIAAGAYTYYKRIGSVGTIHASATLYGTKQVGDEVQYILNLAQTGATYPTIATGSNASTMGAFSVANFAPIATLKAVHLTLLVTSNVAAFVATSAVPAFGASGMLMGNSAIAGPAFYWHGSCYPESGTNVYYGSSGTATLYIIGWKENI